MAKPRFQNLTYEELCKMWDRYHQKYGKYPNSLTCSVKNEELPTWKTVRKVCGDRYIEFTEKYNLRRVVKLKSYEEYCSIFLEISEELGRPLTSEELNAKNQYTKILPTYKWFVDNCPDKSVKSYNDFLYYLGFKPRYEIPKNYAREAILKKYKEMGRPLMYDDFRNPNGIDEIGISTIRKHWGTFNKMLKALNLPVNQEDMVSKHKSIEEMKEDLIRLCNHIKETEGRMVINQREDIENCIWCNSPVSYHANFKKHEGITVGEFIKLIGFIPIDSGTGMNYTFDDGEITTSKHEFQVSNYLRENGIYYVRNKKYKDFIPDYKGQKDCDYVITTKDNEIWYVEVAGVLDYKKQKKENSIRRRYKNQLIEKEKMLKSNNLNYIIIYPHSIADEGLDAMLGFLKSSK